MNSSTASRIAIGWIVRQLLELAAEAFRYRDRTLARELSARLERSGHQAVRGNSVAQSLRRLEQRGLVRRQMASGETVLELTPTGRLRLDTFHLSDLVLPVPPIQWDQQWRLVLFDVPEERRYLRSIFRRKLQQLGFQYLQRSAWIYPFQCEDVLMTLAQRLQLDHCIHIAVVKSLSSDQLVRARFAFLTDAEQLSREKPRPVKGTGMSDRTILSSSVIATEKIDDELLPIDEVVES